MKVDIYQIREDLDNARDMMFRDYQYIKTHIPNLKRDIKSYYNLVYSYDDENTSFVRDSYNQILDDIFHKFNMDRPNDFKGHSLSMSDIVVLDDDNMYFCDAYGWIEVV